jgi:Holliday junction DNA helicase RuvB
VFFIDEHPSPEAALERCSYIAMEDFEIDWVIGQGPAARTMRIPLRISPSSGATTKAGAGVFLRAQPLFRQLPVTLRILQRA